MNLIVVKQRGIQLNVDPSTEEISITFGPQMKDLAVLALQSIATTIETAQHLAVEAHETPNSWDPDDFWLFAARLQGMELGTSDNDE